MGMHSKLPTSEHGIQNSLCCPIFIDQLCPGHDKYFRESMLDSLPLSLNLRWNIKLKN